MEQRKYEQHTHMKATVCVFVCVCLQEMSVGYANGIRVMSMTHTGEPGFMLYIPIEVCERHTHTHTRVFHVQKVCSDGVTLLSPVRSPCVQRGDVCGPEVRHSECWLLRSPQPPHREVLCLLGSGP